MSESLQTVLATNKPSQLTSPRARLSFLVLSWGFGDSGALGRPKPSEADFISRVPEVVEFTESGSGRVVHPRVTEIACGGYHTLALTDGGDVYSWGDGADGQLGTGDRTSHFSPVRVESLPKIKAVAAGFCTSAAVGCNGDVYQWGCKEGQDGKDPEATEPFLQR